MYNVILPTYNESKNIVPLIYMIVETFKQMEVDFKIIIVDDNSPDGTAKIVKKINHPNIKLIERESKLGLGSAYITALTYCKYSYTILMDADLQHDPFYIAGMAKIMDEKHCDIVTGTRYAEGGKVCGWSFMRCLISCSANNIARYTLGLKTTDLTGSFRLYKTSVLKEIIPKIQCKGFGFQMEMISRAELSKKTIQECPIIFYDRASGDSKMGGSEIFKFLKILATLYFTI